MNENTPMTPAQQLFAEEHHNLVYAFLNEKKLPEDEYYDVVVFGYLQAVMDYTTQGESSRFSFATIAWRKMESRLADHFRHQASTKRAAPTVSSMLLWTMPAWLCPICSPQRMRAFWIWRPACCSTIWAGICPAVI